MSNHEEQARELGEKLESWSETVEALERRARKIEGERRERLLGRLDALKLRIQEGRERLRDLRSSGEEEAGSVKEALERSWEDLKVALYETREAFMEELESTPVGEMAKEHEEERSTS